MKRLLAVTLSVAASLALAACQPAKEATSAAQSQEPVSLSGTAFNSMGWQVKLSQLPEGMSAEDVQRALQKRLDAANAVLSTYQPDTELMRFNRAPVNEWQTVSPLLLHALSRAMQVSAQLTSVPVAAGAYDVTVSPLVNAWGFGPNKSRLQPSAEAIAAAKAQVNWQAIRMESKLNRIMRTQPVQVDLSSVGEGAAVDDLSEALTQMGVKHFMVSVAGSLKVRGSRPDGSAWRVAIEKPDGKGGIQQILRLSDGSLSTSGSYRNFFEVDGKRYSHTLDPRTGRPVTHNGVSVSVVSPVSNDDTLADAWATALNVLAPDEALSVANELGLAVYLVEQTADGLVARHSTAFTNYLAE